MEIQFYFSTVVGGATQAHPDNKLKVKWCYNAACESIAIATAVTEEVEEVSEATETDGDSLAQYDDSYNPSFDDAPSQSYYEVSGDSSVEESLGAASSSLDNDMIETTLVVNYLTVDNA